MTQFTILGRKSLVAQWCTHQGLAWQKEWSDPCQFSQNGTWHLLFPFQEGKGAGDGNGGIHIRNRIAQLGKSKKTKGNAFGKGGWGYFWEDRACLSLRFLGHGLVVSTVVSLDLSAEVWHCCSLAASLSALPSFGSHYVLHFLALWRPFPVPFRPLLLHSSYMSLISQTLSRF